MGELLFFRLRRIGIQVEKISSGRIPECWKAWRRQAEGDLVIFFAYSKLSAQGRVILDCRKEAGYRTLAFTGGRI